MMRAKEDIISQLVEALEAERQSAEFWRSQAMMLMARDIETAIYGGDDEQAV
jgi:hypothetical protein